MYKTKSELLFQIRCFEHDRKGYFIIYLFELKYLAFRISVFKFQNSILIKVYLNIDQMHGQGEFISS